ncbi:MAG TPA: HAD family hydrolase [Pyrinomonadaceae bacterium]|nr:HAD family hydrolase [Pyrinomonadaceae bacterium]
MITTIAFDADDTLWHTERIFISTKEKYTDLLADFADKDFIEQHLDETETNNIKHFGYGIKGFTLSMIETACELTGGRITGDKIKQIIGLAKEMLAAPIDVLPGVRETIEALSKDYRLMVVTKGDLLDQETKLARSGLGDYFSAFEIVPRKDAKIYKYIMRRHEIAAEEFLMVGNSLKSDILPVIEAGAQAVFVPYETEWFHERVSDEELEGKKFGQVETMRDLPVWLKSS